LVFQSWDLNLIYLSFFFQIWTWSPNGEIQELAEGGLVHGKIQVMARSLDPKARACFVGALEGVGVLKFEQIFYKLLLANMPPRCQVSSHSPSGLPISSHFQSSPSNGFHSHPSIHPFFFLARLELTDDGWSIQVQLPQTCTRAEQRKLCWALATAAETNGNVRTRRGRAIFLQLFWSWSRWAAELLDTREYSAIRNQRGGQAKASDTRPSVHVSWWSPAGHLSIATVF
jgi:hypothetical protein